MNALSLRSLLCGVFGGVAVLFMYAAVDAPSALAAPPVSSCGASNTTVSANYVAAMGTNHLGYISGVDLSGFDPGCEGDSATLQLWGNASGDPTVPMAGDSLLATLDSTLDPCTQQPLKAPLTVQNESLKLKLCPTGGPAGYVSIHDLTLVALSVNGQTVPVTSSGNTATPALVNSGGSRAILAFTGADFALLVAAGALILSLGATLALLFRRRERWQEPTSTTRSEAG